MNINVAVLLIGGALLATAPAAARTATAPNGDRIRAVPHADLDLATPGGQATLNRRVARALESVCGSYADRSVEEQDRITRCRRDANARIAPHLARILDAEAPVRSAKLDR